MNQGQTAPTDGGLVCSVTCPLCQAVEACGYRPTPDGMDALLAGLAFARKLQTLGWQRIRWPDAGHHALVCPTCCRKPEGGTRG